MKRKIVAVIFILLGMLLLASGESDGPVVAVIGAVVGIVGFVMFFKGGKGPSQKDDTYMMDYDSPADTTDSDDGGFDGDD
jgi:hypothetical protein